MRGISIFFAFFLLIGCKENKSTEQQDIQSESADSTVHFFPVTDYLLGQIAILKSSPINPLQIVEQDSKKDSIWLQREAIDSAMLPFLSPVIDSVNLLPYYNQSRFYDQTLYRYTFSYELKPGADQDLPLKRWDVYINPKTNEVSLIYIIKKTNTDTETQLTWEAGKYCQIIDVKHIAPDSSIIQKKVTIQWDFEG